MIGERKFWLSTITVFLMLAIIYLVTINWPSTTYIDWREREVVHGNYFNILMWQSCLAIPALLYWATNYRLPIQTIIRLNEHGQLGKRINRRTDFLVSTYCLLFYVMPFFRLATIQLNEAQLGEFVTIWSCQVILSGLWLLVVIYLILIIYSYCQKNIFMVSLGTLITVTTIFQAQTLQQSAFTLVAVTTNLGIDRVGTLIHRTLINGVIMFLILQSLKLILSKLIWRWEWFD
ncbi:hypothetical protein [Fructobacillus ficulneus]|uniref:Uncharacterized protein n=1 Tax=Fructobacillus ficulneus TaxID=157463 RepID=A0A0K8MGT4_9LACO|nr:hypothetical protein [Fructobacillus ficulneus]GAO99403.1 hypothetical protein FFIC_100040 [Fructobacillus ficulneus]